jgi:hypothetical protein
MVLLENLNASYMKKKLPTILGGLCITAILFACCITDQNGDPCAVNYVLLALATSLGIGSKITEKKYGQLR